MKKGQVTIFVIGALVLVLLAVLFFVFRNQVSPIIGGKTELNVNQEFSSCIEDSIKNNIELISSHGGYASNNLSLKFQFTGEEETNISYLCYQQNYYLSCINQQPMLIQHLNKELKNQISGDVEGCFNKIVESLKSSGENVEAGYNGFNISMYEDRVVVLVDGKINTEKSGATASYSNLKSIVYTRYYDLGVVAQEIVSQEARFCSFEQVGYMMIHPQYNIQKFRTGKSDTIYTITYRDTNEKFRFAVRSCVIPPGF
jgi:hypothetical protein